MKLTLRHALALLSSMLLWSMAGHAQVRIDMDHDWRFRTDAADAGVAADWPRTTPTETRLVDVPHTWNISPTYDYKRVSIRVGMTDNAASIFSYAYASASDPTGAGPTGPAGDVYLHSHFQVDAQGSVRLYEGLTVFAYGLNLNNAVDWYYTGQPIYVKQMSFFRPTIAIGFKYDFVHDR